MAATTETAHLYNLPLTALVVTDIKGIEDLSTIRGEDGYSPTVSLTSTTINGRSGTLVTIQNTPGNYISSFIADGEKGDRGISGINGKDGRDGADGWTPMLTVGSNEGSYSLAYSYQQPTSKPAGAEVTWEKGINGAPGQDGWTPMLTVNSDGGNYRLAYSYQKPSGQPAPADVTWEDGQTPIFSPVVEYDPLSTTATIKYTYQQKTDSDPNEGSVILPVPTGGGGFDLSQVIDYFGKISLLKPVNEDAQPVFLSARFYSDADMSDNKWLFTIDTALTADQQLGYAYVGGNSEQEAWLPLSSTRFLSGFGPELDNYPIVIDLRSKLSTTDTLDEFKAGKKIYARYSWYWLDQENEAHHSDNYSLVFPSTSEVGAASGARAIGAAKRLNTVTTSMEDDIVKYAISPGIPNVIVPEFSGDVDILLADFSSENSYTFKFKTKAGTSTSLTFLVRNIAGVDLPYTAINNKMSHYQINAGKEYLMSIELDMVSRFVEN